MLKTLTLVLFLSIGVKISGQDLGAEFDTASPFSDRLYTEGFAYPFVLEGETHSNFTVGLEFDPKFLAELQGFYDTYRLANVFDVSFRGKKYITDKFYIFSGMGAEFESDKYGRQSPPIRLKIMNGMGYDFNQKFFLEAKRELHLNQSNYGNYATPNLFLLSSKYKF